MLDSVEIKNFKRIEDPGLKLENLARVNYLVGENGSGKSSVLEGAWVSSSVASELLRNSLSLNGRAKLNKQEPYLFNFLGPRITFSQSLKSFLTPTLPKIKREGALFIHSSIENNGLEKRFNTIKSFESLEKEYYTLRDNHILEAVERKTSKFISLWRDGHEDTPAHHIFMNGLLKTSDAGGIQKLNCIINLITIDYILDHNVDIILIEEPEINLHPKWQKKLPKLFDELAEELGVQFFISTHSPFIISGASELPDQKVYLIDDGQCVDLYGKASSKGFSAGESILVVNKMLGSGLNDFFPTVLIFCEESMKVFLESFVRKNGLDVKPVFVTKGGDADFIRKSEIFSQLVKSFESYKSEKFTDLVKTKVFAIFDQNKDVKELKEKFSKNYEEALLEINSDEQEKLYPMDIINEFLLSGESEFKKIGWDKEENENFLDFLRGKLGLDEKSKEKDEKREIIQKQGKFKSKLAEFVGSKISEDQFREYFGEIYKAIFNN